jgi:hypothetical protein
MTNISLDRYNTASSSDASPAFVVLFRALSAR